MGFLLSVVVLAAVLFAFMLTKRLYRSEVRPKWLDMETVVMPICVAFTGAFAAAVGGVVAMAVRLPMPIWANMGAAVAAIVAVTVVARLGFRYAVRRGNAPAV